MPVTVKPNHFYKVTDIGEMVYVTPDFVDLPQGSSSTTVDLRGGVPASYILLSGSTPAPLKYGGGELKGGHLRMFVDSFDTAAIPSAPELSLYKLDDSVTAVSEGSLTSYITTGTEQTATFDATSDVVTLAANTPANPKDAGIKAGMFVTSKNKALGISCRVLQVTTSSIILEYPPRATETDTTLIFTNSKLYPSIYHSTAPDEPILQENFDGANKFLGAGAIGQNLRATLPFLTIPIAASIGENINIKNGRSEDQESKEKILKKYFSDATQTKIFLKPRNYEAPTTDKWLPANDGRKDGDDNKLITLPRWKWDEIKDILEYDSVANFPSDNDASPTASPNTTIFSDFFVSPRINNPYSANADAPLMLSLCELTNTNAASGGQSLHFHHLWDYSNSMTGSQSSTTAYTTDAMLGVGKSINPQSARATLYNIPKPSPGFELGNAEKATQATDMRSVVPEVSLTLNIAKLEFSPPLMSSGSSNYMLSGTSYYGWALNGSNPNSHQATNSNPLGSLDTIDTFLRSVCVTFSNYKPKPEHTTLDRFLDYGLSRFYANTENCVVGGVVFRKQAYAPEDDRPNIYAYALPVTRFANATANTPGQTGLFKAVFDTNLSNSVVLGSGPFGPNNSATNPRSVALPFNSWFKMRCLFDTFAYNNTGSYVREPYSSPGDHGAYNSDEERGVPLRVLFEGAVQPSGTTDGDANENIPFIDVPFPCLSGTAEHDSYILDDTPTGFTNNNPNWPKHMTIWVQNYRWVSGSDASANFIRYGDNQFIASGAAIETEVFVDDVILKGFAPAVTNCSSLYRADDTQVIPWKQNSILTAYNKLNNNSTKQLTVWSTGTTGVTGGTAAFEIENQVQNLYEANPGQVLTIGFDVPASLPITTDDYAADSSGYILFSGFSTLNSKDINPITSGFVGNVPSASGGTYSSLGGGGDSFETLGGTIRAKHYTSSAVNADNSIVDRPYIYTGSDTNLGTSTGFQGSGNFTSVDGFTQKGFLKVNAPPGTFGASDGWIKRENISCSTKILEIANSQNNWNAGEIRVHNPSIFNFEDHEEEYVIYRMGQAITYATMDHSTVAKGMGDNQIIVSARNDDNTNIIELAVKGTGSTAFPFSDGNGSAKTESTKLLSEEFLSDLWISPKKYWISLFHNSNDEMIARTYTNAVTVTQDISGSTVSGSTFNEYDYGFNSSATGSLGQSGLYVNNYDLSVNAESSSLVLNRDYGFGAYDEETGAGGELSKTVALSNQYAYFNFENVNKNKDLGPDLPFNMRLGLTQQTVNRTVVLSTEDETSNTKKPQLLWEYMDMPPKFDEPLTVGPAFDILNAEVNLYDLTREDYNNLKFLWKESEKDIFSRLLMIDTEPISNKYHKSIFWAPLNEPITTNTTSDSPSYYYESGANEATKTQLGHTGSSYTKTVEGLNGYAVINPFIRTDPTKTGGYLSGSTEFTITVAVVPNDTTAGTSTNCIVTDYYDTSAKCTYLLELEKPSGANSDVTPVFTLVSGTSNNYNSHKVEITGNRTYINDGDTPLFITVTFDNSLAADCIKMYVNGEKVAGSAGNWVTGRTVSTGDMTAAGKAGLRIGQQDTITASRFAGTIEELVFYSKAYEVPENPNQYIYNTKTLSNYSDSGSSATLNRQYAKLFLFDYHNFIGKSRDEVTSSQLVAWEATGI